MDERHQGPVASEVELPSADVDWRRLQIFLLKQKSDSQF